MTLSRSRARFATLLSGASLFLIVLVAGHLGSAISDSSAFKPGAPAAPANVITIVNYNFNSGSSYAALTPTLAPGITSTATSTEPFAVLAGTITDANAFTATPIAGNALAMLNSNGTNTRYFQFQLGGTTLPLCRTYKVYVQAQRSSPGAQTLTLAYSTNGTTFTNFAPAMSPGNGSFVSNVFDLSSVSALNNQSSVTFRLMASGASGTGTLLIDNFQVQANIISCPSLFTVNNLGDSGDAAPGDGVCDDGTGNCTLRAAL